MVSRSASFCALSWAGRMNDWSILMNLGRSTDRYESDEKPVPKSSSAIAVAETAELFHDAHRLGDVAQGHLFGDLKNESLGRHGELINRLLDQVDESVVVELTRREIDRDVRPLQLWRVSIPRTRRRDSFAKREGAEGQNHVTLFGQGNEDVGWHESSRGMMPSHQRFKPEDFGGVEINDGLVVHRELFVRESGPQVTSERMTTRHLLLHTGREHDVLATTLVLCLVQRDVGVLDEHRTVHVGFVPHRDADAGELIEQRSSDDEGLS